jgi:hypothetical protein
MTEIEINKNIAYHMGYVGVAGRTSMNRNRMMGIKYLDDPWKIIPDYCNDLNAMAEVETSLSPAELERYTDELGVRSSALERAVVFLVVKGHKNIPRVEVTQDELKNLKKRDSLLTSLFDHGLVGWEGYDDAIREWEKETNKQ